MYSHNKRIIEHDSGSTFCPGKPFAQFAARWPDSLLCEESRAGTRRWARCIPGCRGTIATPQGIAEPAAGLPCRGSTAICVLGAPPPNRYIDAFTQNEGHACYAGLRKAAELHGATHRAVVEIQVVSTKRLPSTRVGRNRIAFYFRKNNQAVTAGIEDRKTDTGTLKIVGCSFGPRTCFAIRIRRAESTMSPPFFRTSAERSIPEQLAPPFGVRGASRYASSRTFRP